MANFEQAENIQARVRSVIGANASALISLPEIENAPTAEAIRKLQIQIFELADALASLPEEIRAQVSAGVRGGQGPRIHPS